MRQLIQTYEEAQQAIAAIAEADILAFDTETTGLDLYHGDVLIGASFYIPATDTAYYFPFRHRNSNGSVNLPEDILPRLLDALCFKVRPVLMFNAKFDMHVLHTEGGWALHVIEDVMLAAHLLNENEALSNGKMDGAYTLKRLAAKYLGPEALADQDFLYAALEEAGFSGKGSMVGLPPHLVGGYAMADVELTWKLREFYRPALERWKQWETYQGHNAVLLEAVFRMERNGFLLDLSNYDPASDLAEAEGIRQWFAEFTGNPKFNPGSPVQVKLAFAQAGIALASTKREVLEELAENEMAQLILRYRFLTKVNSTFYEPYTRLVCRDGRLRTSLNMATTRTGRLSCSEPNLQQVPRKGKYQIKKLFVPTPGRLLVQLDYKAMELVLATYYAQETKMAALFHSGEDMHQRTADWLGIPRQVAKGLNFGLLYGLGVKRDKGYKLAHYLGLSDTAQAVELWEAWHALYPRFRKALWTFARLAGMPRDLDGYPDEESPYRYIRIPFDGRIRHFHEQLSYGLDETFKAFNFLVQGTGASVMKASMLRIARAFPNDDDVRLLLTVHDSLIVDIDPARANELIPQLIRMMTDWPFDPRLNVDVEVSNTDWMTMRKYDPAEFAS